MNLWKENGFCAPWAQDMPAIPGKVRGHCSFAPWAQDMEGRKDCGKEGGRILTESQKIPDLIFAKLINTENHRELLSKVPNEAVLDLSLVFYQYRNDDPDGEEILVTEEMMDLWDVEDTRVYEDAMLNTRTLMGERIRPLKDMIGEMIKDMDFDMDLEEDEGAMPMYVLTNLWKRNGAVCVLYQDTLQELADQLGSDLFVIPSSIHEVILVPADHGISRADLDRLIREINTTELEDEDVLSDHSYFFSRKRGKMEM